MTRLDPRARQVLFALPQLRGLSDLEREEIAELFEEIAVPQGEVLFQEGDPTDASYIVVRGAVDLEIQGRRLTRVPPGEIFGAVTDSGEPRIVTATAALDCRLLRISSDALQHLREERPELFASARAAVNRAFRVMAGREMAWRNELVLIESEEPWPARREIVIGLADALERELGSPVAVLTVASTGAAAPRPARDNGLDAVEALDPERREAARERLTEVSGELSGRVPYVLFEDDDSWPRVDLGLEPDLLIERITGTLPAEPSHRARRVIWLHDRRDGPGPAVSGADIASLPEAEPQRALAFERLARNVAERSVGIALGSGAAWGLAHIGVLEVLHEAGIPVDLVAGASMGAIVGGHYALGIPPSELREIVSRVKRPIDFLPYLRQLLYMAADFNVFQPGLFAGEHFKRVMAAIAPITGKTFADLEIPFRAVATDIETGARAELFEGEISDAVHASFAAPWILSPHRIGDRVFIDGGMVDPVPSEPVRSMGADLVIAVNVVPPLDPDVTSPLQRALGALGRVNPLRRSDERLPGSFDVVTRTLQLMQHQLGNDRAGEADVLITPALQEFWLLEFWSGEAMIEKGADAAAAALPAIRARIEALRKTPVGEPRRASHR